MCSMWISKNAEKFLESVLRHCDSVMRCSWRLVVQRWPDSLQFMGRPAVSMPLVLPFGMVSSNQARSAWQGVEDTREVMAF